MKRFITRIFVLILFLTISSPAIGQFTTVDWGLHDVGRVTELVNNRGSLHPFALPSYPRLLNAEFPQGSFVEHHNAVAPFYAALSKDKQDTLVTTVRIFAWNSANELNGYSSAPWDTVWEARRGDTVDIPYEPNYVSKSDQDLITRYNDYNEGSIKAAEHDPLFIDVFQHSWSWASEPLNQFIIFNLEVIPTQKTIHNLWPGIFFNTNVGLITGSSPAQDDFVTYHPDHNMVIAHDAPGNEGSRSYTPMAVKILPPTDLNQKNLNWTFQWAIDGGLRVPRDKQRYEQVVSGEDPDGIQEDQELTGNTSAIISYGEIDSLAKGDTLNWKYATIYGEDVEELKEKSALIDTLAPDFNVPAPPPAPIVDVTTRNREVTLEWGDRSETYDDPNRSDGAKKPFEGYRVYKSTESRTGPWTLLAEFDLQGNPFGQNTGIKHKFTDTGLMNNVEYFYAVTAFSKPDTVLNFPSQATSQRANAISVNPGTPAAKNLGKVAVVPNPYRGDIDYNESNPPWEKPPSSRQRWLEQDRRIQFINLPAHSTIKIYTLSGRLVETLTHDNPNNGFVSWNLTSNVNQAVASGIYLFTVKNEDNGNTQTGKFVIIK